MHKTFGGDFIFRLDRFKALCSEKGIKQSALFRSVGKDEFYASNLRRMKNVPAEYVEKWAESLQTTSAYLMGETDDPEIKKAPTLSGEHSKEAQEFAAEFSDFTPDEWAELRRYADFLKSQRSDEGQK